MKTIVILEITHRKPLPVLANMIAGRAYTIDGVTNAELVTSPSMSTRELENEGFTLAEISLSSGSVERS